MEEVNRIDGEAKPNQLKSRRSWCIIGKMFYLLKR